MKKVYTICIVCKPDRILLGMKKRGFGSDKWNGFGGKVEDGEDVETCASRELLEEAGIEVKKINKVGVIEFLLDYDPEIKEAHIFRIDNFIGTPIETEEMRPQWFNIDEIPYDQMWEDDKSWLPYVLDNKKFKGKFHFSKSNETEKIVKKELREVAEL